MKRIDDLMLARAVKARVKSGKPLTLIVNSYNMTDLLVASSRRCDDGCTISNVLLVKHATGWDLPVISDLFHGCPSKDPPRFEFHPCYFYQ